MMRGIYTAASSMKARNHQMNVISNNLANVNTTGYKKDISIFKSFPEMLIRRINDKVYRFPEGSRDAYPIVGKIGTGVELNEVFNEKSMGNLRNTENKLDLAIRGKKGFFNIMTQDGERYTRSGSFLLNNRRELVTQEGEFVMGKNGKITIDADNFTIDKRGRIYANEGTSLIDQINIVDFRNVRFLKKQGDSFYKTTEESGEAFSIEINIESGFLETSNVNAIEEMVKMIEVQRSYEASQKTVVTHDEMTNKLINSMARV